MMFGACRLNFLPLHTVRSPTYVETPSLRFSHNDLNYKCLVPNSTTEALSDRLGAGQFPRAAQVMRYTWCYVNGDNVSMP